MAELQPFCFFECKNNLPLVAIVHHHTNTDPPCYSEEIDTTPMLELPKNPTGHSFCTFASALLRINTGREREENNLENHY